MTNVTHPCTIFQIFNQINFSNHYTIDTVHICCTIIIKKKKSTLPCIGNGQCACITQNRNLFHLSIIFKPLTHNNVSLLCLFRLLPILPSSHCTAHHTITAPSPPPPTPFPHPIIPSSRHPVLSRLHIFLPLTILVLYIPSYRRMQSPQKFQAVVTPLHSNTPTIHTHTN